jgi:hypothetical protein
MPSPDKLKTTDQLYTLADLARILQVPPKRLNQLRESGDLLGPDVSIPGGGHKGQRWSATQVNLIKLRWSTAALVTG